MSTLLPIASLSRSLFVRLSVFLSACLSHIWFTGQVAETGEQTTNDNLFPADPHGIGMHNALWASMASMGAMSSAVWWWDNWVAPNNLCTHRSMGAFALPTHHTLIVSRGLFAGAVTATSLRCASSRTVSSGLHTSGGRLGTTPQHSAPTPTPTHTTPQSNDSTAQ